MRGAFFVKHIKATGSENINRVVDGQVTRTCVANTVAMPKAVGAAKRDERATKKEDGAAKKEVDEEQIIWKEAGESVLNHHNKEVENQSS